MFTKSKHYGMNSLGLISVGIIVSFVMSIVVGYAQDNSPAQYNVTGVTMPVWFYLILAVNAVVLLFGVGNALLAIIAVVQESGAAKIESKNVASMERESEPVEFDVVQEDLHHEESMVYDPQRALER